MLYAMTLSIMALYAAFSKNGIQHNDTQILSIQGPKAEYHYADYHYAECRVFLTFKCYAECFNAECYCAERCYAECYYAECHGAGSKYLDSLHSNYLEKSWIEIKWISSEKVEKK